MSCFGFATLMIRTPGPPRCPARAITSSVPFHRLDSDDGLMLDGDRLTDVEPGDRVGHRDSRTRSPLFVRRSAPAS